MLQARTPRLCAGYRGCSVVSTHSREPAGNQEAREGLLEEVTSKLRPKDEEELPEEQ